MKKTTKMVLRVLISLFVAGAAETGTLNLIQGKITHNTTWDTAHGPYLILGDTTVEKGVVLTIKPGTQVLFAPANPQAELQPVPAKGAKLNGPSLIVEGALVAIGNPDKTIYFGSPDHKTKGSIYFHNGAQGASVMKLCVIDGQKLVCNGAFPLMVKCLLDGSPMGLDEDAYAMAYYFKHSI